MTVRHLTSVVAALLVLLFGVSCSDRDAAPLPAETDEPFYVQGLQLMKQGRHSEALTAFLKVIDKRGERQAPESHLEAGQIFLNHAKDPVEAYHHFRKYLELQPNSNQSKLVRGMVEVARREFVRTIPGRPVDDPSSRTQDDEEMAKIRRENAELKAELATLRGGGAMAVNRAPRTITLPEDPRPVASPPVATVIDEPRVAAAPAPAPTPVRAAPPVQRAPVTAPPAQSRSTPTAPATARGGRTYTVKQREGLFAIARQFDPANPGRKMREIVDANPDVLTGGVNTVLKAGMVLRIP